ncbi:MAG: TRAP-type mannitol/chloroaromatic compound transport system permease small subunit [Lysobacterales bacterium]|jgi:TRAP-type mannitol/chloroaromatic compound transport system permease small subunit
MNILEKIVELCGKAVAWLTLLMVLLTFTIVVLRYGFNLGWIWLQESLSYMHAMVFMLVAAWTLQDDGHVRVDIFYRDRTARHKALVNFAGTIVFLVPLCLFLIIIAWDYVYSSWTLLEKSREAGGLPFVYLFKSLILLLPVLLLLQAVPNLVKSFEVLRKRPNDGLSN